jgi:hypothetical protein
MRTLPLIAFSAALLTVLAGCAPAATPAPVPTPTETVAPYLGEDLTYAAGADYPTDVPVGFAIGLPSAGFAYQSTLSYGVVYKNTTNGCLVLVSSGFAPTDFTAKATGDEDGSLAVVDSWFPGIDNSTVSEAKLIWVGGNKADFKFADYIRPDNGNEQLYWARYVKAANIVLALMIDCGPANPTRPKDVADSVLAHIGVVPQVTTFPQ